MRILIVSSMLGSLTSTGWKRRARAESFSISRNSLIVVAPTNCSSPLARAGLMMLPASMPPSELPTPTISWISSIKRMMSGWLCSSLTSCCILCSNWPRIPVPWTMETMLREMIRLFCNLAGTDPSTMSWARPSTTAVLPTPASPIKTGLFLVRRLRISITRAISRSRPITGSILPFLARAVKSVPNWSSRDWPPPLPPRPGVGPDGFWLLSRFAPFDRPFKALKSSSKSPKKLSLFI